MKDFYYLAYEWMGCPRCHKIYKACDQNVLEQLPDYIRQTFPCVLSLIYACDKVVLNFLRSRTLGNSPFVLYKNLREMHDEEWKQRALTYLTDCDRHKSGVLGMIGSSDCSYEEPPPPAKVGGARWLTETYVRQVWSRMSVVLRALTSTFGSILKIDSTAKICKKFRGKDANSAKWATNVGNEKGEILQCVLTESESSEALQPLADGLMKRYKAANVAAPVLLYTDRDCCGRRGSRLNALFHDWPELIVLLDIWHFMRRIALACQSENHALYPIFMKRLSRCIFEWDPVDVKALVKAKTNEMKSKGVTPSEKAVRSSLTRDELARHCKRRTREEPEIVKAIEELLLSMAPAADSFGVKLLNPKATEVWLKEKKHVKCIQDPVDIPLYAKVGEIQRGGMALPHYRCARGTTSLESFHGHIVKFIPGSTASARNLHAYLIEGISRWNADRVSNSQGTYDIKLQTKLNEKRLKSK